MPLISFVKNKAPLVVESGANLMKALTDAQIPVASSCAGDGICSKCVIEIINGHENLSQETDLELELKERNQVPSQFRVSCQTRVLGDITIDTGYW